MMAVFLFFLFFFFFLFLCKMYTNNFKKIQVTLHIPSETG